MAYRKIEIIASAHSIKNVLPNLVHPNDVKRIDVQIGRLLQRNKAGVPVTAEIRKLLFKNNQTKRYTEVFVKEQRRELTGMIFLENLNEEVLKLQDLAGDKWLELRDYLLENLDLDSLCNGIPLTVQQMIDICMKGESFGGPVGEVFKELHGKIRLDRSKPLSQKMIKSHGIDLPMILMKQNRNAWIKSVSGKLLDNLIARREPIIAEVGREFPPPEQPGIDTQEPSPRYPEFRIYYELEDNGRGSEVLPGYSLRLHKWYQLVVSVKEKPEGIPPYEKRIPIREPRQEQEVTLDVIAVDLDGDFDVEHSVGNLVLPTKGNSTTDFVCRLSPKKKSQSIRDLAQLEVKIYYEFNLLVWVILQAEVVGAGDDESRSYYSLKEPIRFKAIKFGTQSSLIDFKDINPRQMNISVSKKEDGAYSLSFVFKNKENQVEFPKIPVRLSTDFLKDTLKKVRVALWKVVNMRRMEGQDAEDPVVLYRELYKLAQHGRWLWTRLFNKDFDSAMWAVGDWLERHLPKDHTRIQVNLAQSAEDFLFPWSLLYDRKLPESENSAPDLEGFWGIRYIIEVLPPWQNKSDDRPIEVKNDFEIGFFLWPFAQADSQKEFIRKMAFLRKGRIANNGFAITGFEQANNLLDNCNSHLLYFFTHGHTPVTDNPCGWIKPDEFVRLYEELPSNSASKRSLRTLYTEIKDGQFDAESAWIKLENSTLLLDNLYSRNINLAQAPIVILNMCESACIAPSYPFNFVHLFLNRGAKSVLGTECTMDTEFGHQFSQSLLRLIVDGCDIGHALLEARREFGLGRMDLSGLAYTLMGRATTKYVPALSTLKN